MRWWSLCTKLCYCRCRHRQSWLLLFICLATLLPLVYHWYDETENQLWYIEDIWEQLGKAKFHLLEQAFIASQLQRTLLLPNVGQSQIGMRYPHSFNLYYQSRPFSQLVPTMSVVDFRLSFLDETRRRRQITAALIYILVVGKCSQRKLTWSDVRSNLWLQLQTQHDLMLLEPPMCFETKYGWAAPAYPRPIIDHLRKMHSQTDIIVAIKDSYFFLMDPAVMPIHLLKHNRTLISVAETFARIHQPFVAVHWRMEEAKGNGLECARILINTTRRFAPPYKVYFATDHPVRNELKSSSFSNCCRVDQTRGYKHVLHTLRPLTLENISSPSLGTDSGSWSIVEKLICQQAKVFLAGNAPCDRHGSFGREMIKFRQVIARTPWLYWSQPNATYEPHKAYPW